MRVDSITNLKMENAKLQKELDFTRGLLESANSIVIRWNKDGIIHFMNDFGLRFFGYTSEALIGQNLLTIFPKVEKDTGRDMPQFIKEIGHNPDRHSSVLIENITKGGRTVWVTWSNKGIFDPQGNVQEIFTIGNDMTAQRETENSLREAEWKFKALFENSPVGVAYHSMIYDETGNAVDYSFLDANEKYIELTGIDPRGKRVTECFPGIENDHFDWIGTFGRVAKGGETIRFEQYLEVNDRWYDCVAYRYKPDHFVVVFQEITERKRVEQKLLESEGKFRAIFEQSGGYCMILDPNTADGIPVIVDANVAACQVHGYTREEFIGRPISDIDDEDGKRLIKKRISEIMKGKPLYFENVHVRKDGTLVDVAVNANLFYIGGGPPLILSTEYEISDRKRVEAENKRLTDRLLLTTSSAQLGIWDWNVRENTMVWDDRMFEMYGVTREGTPDNIDAWLNGLHPDDKESAVAACQAALAGGKGFDMDFRVLHPDGTVKHLKANGLVLMGTDGKPDRMLGINMDITEVKNLFNERLRAGQLVSLGQLAAGVAHEINNPINGIINYAQILLNKEPEGTFSKKILEGINKEGRRIAGIVANLLNFVKKDAQEKKFTAPTSLFVEPLNLMMQFFRNEGIHIDVKTDRDLPEVYCNPMQIEQVILNLLSNARHALNEKYPNENHNKFIILDAEEITESACVQLTIQDMGTGIPKENIKRLFEPFFTTKRAGIGTGIGLSISKDILAQNRGDISIESESGKYTKVTLILPTTEG